MRLVDRGVGLGASASIRIRDRNPAKGLTAYDPRLLAIFPVRIKERVRSERVAVRPAIDGDALDVACGIEAGRSKQGSELLADVAFESGEGRAHELSASGAILIANRPAGFARRAKHEQYDRFFRVAGEVIVAETDRVIECGEAVVAAG